MKTTNLLCLASASVLCANAANAQLLGDAIDVNLDGGIVLADLGVVVGAGVELQGGDASTNFGAFLFPMEFIDIGDASIDMAFDLPLGDMGMLTFSDLDFGAGIGDVALTSNNAAVGDAQLSFTTDSITLDLSDWFFEGGPAVFNLQLTEVPAPGALALAGAAGLAATRRRRA
jgi:MYXO-CTERM domain-containing protein